MSAIFISSTTRDPHGDDWAELLAAWFSEWTYEDFRDKDHSHVESVSDNWQQTSYGELADATAAVCLCSKQNDTRPGT